MKSNIKQFFQLLFVSIWFATVLAIGFGIGCYYAEIAIDWNVRSYQSKYLHKLQDLRDEVVKKRQEQIDICQRYLDALSKKEKPGSSSWQ